jgi:hypothetical protein
MSTLRKPPHLIVERVVVQGSVPIEIQTEMVADAISREALLKTERFPIQVDAVLADVGRVSVLGTDETGTRLVLYVSREHQGYMVSVQDSRGLISAIRAHIRTLQRPAPPVTAHP